MSAINWHAMPAAAAAIAGRATDNHDSCHSAGDRDFCHQYKMNESSPKRLENPAATQFASQSDSQSGSKPRHDGKENRKNVDIEYRGKISVAGEVLFSGDFKSVVLVLKLSTGRYSLPKGKLEPGETWLIAAPRERFEETGILSKDVLMMYHNGVAVFLDEFNEKDRHSCRYAITKLTRGPAVETPQKEFITVTGKEVAKWFSLKEMAELDDSVFRKRRKLIVYTALAAAGSNPAPIAAINGAAGVTDNEWKEPLSIAPVKKSDRTIAGLGGDVSVSKALSSILRHNAVKRGLVVRPDGGVAVDQLLKLAEFSKIGLPDLERITRTSDKQRFHLYEDEKTWFIKANQGHSQEVGNLIDDEKLLKPLAEALPVCVHGTTRKAWKVIQREGLKPMKRKHIHFASQIDPELVVSGMRKSSSVHILVDMKRAIADGIPFFLSQNGVILSPGINGCIPPKYFLTPYEEKQPKSFQSRTITETDGSQVLEFDFKELEAAFIKVMMHDATKALTAAAGTAK